MAHLVFEIDLHITAGKDILTDGQNHIAPGKCTLGLVIILDKIGRQAHISLGDLNIAAGNILVQLLVVGHLIGQQLPRQLAVIL